MRIKTEHPQTTRLFEAATAKCGCKSWADIARLLNKTDQILTNWKARGIPKGELMDIAEQVHVNPYWLRDGSGSRDVITYDADVAAIVQIATAMEPTLRPLYRQQGSALVEHQKSARGPEEPGKKQNSQ